MVKDFNTAQPMRDKFWINEKIKFIFHLWCLFFVFYLDLELGSVICIVMANTIIVAQRRIWNHAKNL